MLQRLSLAVLLLRKCYTMGSYRPRIRFLAGCAPTVMDRRQFLAIPLMLNTAPRAARRFHLSVSPDGLEQNPELLQLASNAGVTTVWLAGYLYGHWYYTPERLGAMAKKVRHMGMEAEVVFVPLGHPGDSLGARKGEPPLIPPPHWKQCVHLDGTTHWGTSLHAPAMQENAAALARLDGLRFTRVFLDDDFRLATGPGTIGGCFCEAHWKRFANIHGYGASVRDQLAGDIGARNLSPKLKAWIDFHGSELTACFRDLQRAQPLLKLGNMVMFLGAEKAGIQLDEYRDVPFRVGELMFSDRQFDPVKGKTDELFSSLFHRRFARPELAYSETTAFPADRLSASNMAAKLAVSTLSDVRNTMMMSGLTPFPMAHWDVLGPAMKKQAAIHAQVAGHKPSGPFKHYWGEHSRYVGDDKPFSLFLAAGVPFEICDTAPSNGWTFLSEADAADRPKSAGTEFVSRRDVPETLPDLFAFRRRILSRLSNVPYIEEEEPVVCSWLPAARRILVWNLANESRTLTLRHRSRRIPVSANALELVVLSI